MGIIILLLLLFNRKHLKHLNSLFFESKKFFIACIFCCGEMDFTIGQLSDDKTSAIKLFQGYGIKERILEEERNLFVRCYEHYRVSHKDNFVDPDIGYL